MQVGIWAKETIFYQNAYTDTVDTAIQVYSYNVKLGGNVTGTKTKQIHDTWMFWKLHIVSINIFVYQLMYLTFPSNIIIANM